MGGRGVLWFRIGPRIIETGALTELSVDADLEPALNTSYPGETEIISFLQPPLIGSVTRIPPK